MTTVVNHEFYGQIVYSESFWTGKKQIVVGGVLAVKDGKKSFSLPTPEGNIPITVSGNAMTSVKLTIGPTTVMVTPTPKWYEYILMVLPFVLVMVWSSSVALVSIVPVVGGAIGGVISGAFAMISLSVMRSMKTPLHKVLIGLAMTVCAFIACAILGFYLIVILAAVA